VRVLAGGATSTVAHDRPAFYFDLGSPDAYLAAERVLATMPVATEWIPVLAASLPAADDLETFRCAQERASVLADVETRAARRGLQPLRWPDPFPFDSALAMRAATYAKQIGRTVAFGLAAFRQAFAGGRSLADPDTVLIAAAACEMHPAALLKAVELRSVREELHRQTALADEMGVRDVPAVRVGERVFHGDVALDAAARAAAR
jgi:2-hydroxychromene-2-carboxylate isomerase